MCRNGIQKKAHISHFIQILTRPNFILIMAVYVAHHFSTFCISENYEVENTVTAT
jgi:hypothetical protein